MPKRFLSGVTPPRAYPLGLIGPGDMDPQHLPFVTKVTDAAVWRLANVVILVHGWRYRLSYNLIGGVEEVAKFYAKRYWYDVRIYRGFTKRGGDDPAFFADAKGFVAFDDGCEDVARHLRFARATGKPVKRFKLLEKW